METRYVTYCPLIKDICVNGSAVRGSHFDGNGRLQHTEYACVLTAADSGGCLLKSFFGRPAAQSASQSASAFKML